MAVYSGINNLMIATETLRMQMLKIGIQRHLNMCIALGAKRF